MGLRLLVRIARGEAFERVRVLYCNLDHDLNALQQPDDSALKFLERLYTELIQTRRQGFRPNLRYFFNCVDFTQAIENSAPVNLRRGFGQKLISSHSYFLGFEFLMCPCPSVRSVDYLEVLSTIFNTDPTDTPWLQQEQPLGRSFDRFFSVYPNIQIVTLINTAGSDPFLSGTRFLDFLSQCRGLSKLELRNSRLPFSILNRLSELESLRTLETFILIEAPYNLAAADVSFWFLTSFRYLRHFESNLVTRERSADLVAMMRTDSIFVFSYDHPSFPELSHRVIVRRQMYSNYQVILTHTPIGQRERIVCETKRSLHLNLIRDYLLLQTDVYIPHWLN